MKLLVNNDDLRLVGVVTKNDTTGTNESFEGDTRIVTETEQNVVTYEYDNQNEVVSGNSQKFVNLYTNTKKYKAMRNLYLPWLIYYMEKYPACENQINPFQ